MLYLSILEWSTVRYLPFRNGSLLVRLGKIHYNIVVRLRMGFYSVLFHLGKVLCAYAVLVQCPFTNDLIFHTCPFRNGPLCHTCPIKSGRPFFTCSFNEFFCHSCPRSLDFLFMAFWSIMTCFVRKG
jgi:hypothetical protein